MTEFPRREVEEAWAEFQRRGVQTQDWAGWADLFTDDALYEEHNLGVFHGRDEIKSFIVDTMKDYPEMTLWIEWSVIDGNRIGFYIWNNLPDPTGTGQRFGFPNTTLLEYAGDGKFSFEGDYYNPVDAERVFRSWLEAGGKRTTPQDPSLRGIDDWNPEPPSPAHPRSEVDAEFAKYRERAALAVATGDWDQWADQFTDDARYYEHHYGKFRGQTEIREWIKGVMQPFPEMDFPVEWHVIDGNRVVMLCQNRLPDPSGGDAVYQFPTLVVLHYAGGGKWSYEEDVYNPAEAPPVVADWVAAGGQLPEGMQL